MTDEEIYCKQLRTKSTSKKKEILSQHHISQDRLDSNLTVETRKTSSISRSRCVFQTASSFMYRFSYKLLL